MIFATDEPVILSAPAPPITFSKPVKVSVSLVSVPTVTRPEPADKSTVTLFKLPTYAYETVSRWESVPVLSP